MLIFGTRAVTRTLQRGTFNCPTCDSTQNFELKTAKKHGHLYFIPLLPMGDSVEYVECAECKETFRTEVLRASAAQDMATSEIDKALRRILVSMMLVDGNIQDSEVQMISKVYAQITNRTLSRAEIMTEASAVENDGLSAAEYAAAISLYMNDPSRELLVRAAISIAAADGDFHDAEGMMITEIAAAIGMSRAHLKGIFADLMEPAEA